MISKILSFVNTKGSSLVLPAHGKGGARATSLLAAHFALRNTASNFAEKKGSPSEGVAEGGGWGEEFRHARSVAKRFRRLALSQTSKQNNFQFLLRKIWRAGFKKLKEKCFALLADVRRAETKLNFQKKFELPHKNSSFRKIAFLTARFSIRLGLESSRFCFGESSSFERSLKLNEIQQPIFCLFAKGETSKFSE